MNMDLIYSMRRKPLKCEPPHFDSSTDSETVRPICTISTANIIAFSSPTELSDVDGDTWGGHVYVCDLDTPWNCYKVTSTSHPVSALEWDMEGKQLLVATSVGDVSVYGMKEYLLNDWHCLYSGNFPGEHIIKAAFFHNGRRIVMLDKKPDAPITERIQMLRSTPTLKGFGGAPSEGLCVVTATGLVGAVTPRAAGPAGVAAEALREPREHLTSASIAYKAGALLIAAACGRGRGARVRAWLVAVAPALAVQPLPAVYTLDGDVPAVVSWWSRWAPDALAVAGRGALALWKCAERAHPLHKLLAKGPLQGSTTPGSAQKPASDSFNTVSWVRAAVWATEGARALAAASAPLAPRLVLAAPRALQLLAPDDHHVLCSRQVAPGAPAEPAAASPPKKPKYGAGVPSAGVACASVSDACVSALGGVVVCVDTHAQLHVYRLPQPWGDVPSPPSVAQATAVLEYALVSGVDCLDVILTFRPGLIEPLYERFTESFQRQPAAFQQYYYHGWLKLRAAICRQSPALQACASSLTAVQMCHATLAVCVAALRDERPDAAPLDDDDEKNLAALEAKPELLSEGGCGAALRLGLQRARDVALTAAAQLAHTHHHHGYDIWADPVALGVLRKLLAVARAGGRGGDALARLLARAHAPRHDLYEECSALAAQPGSPRVWEALPRCSVSAPHGRAWPLYLEYGVEPESLRYTPEPPAYAQCESSPPLAMDSIRYMYLGGGRLPAKWRACSRCGARALPHAHTARHPLQRAHDARFLPNCRCGGKWSLCKNI